MYDILSEGRKIESRRQLEAEMERRSIREKKIFEYNWIQKITNNANLRKQDFLSEEKISDRSRFVKKMSHRVDSIKIETFQ